MDRCVICREEEWDDCFEIQEFINKEQYVFKVRGKPFYSNPARKVLLALIHINKKGEPISPNNVHHRDTTKGNTEQQLKI